MVSVGHLRQGATHRLNTRSPHGIGHLRQGTKYRLNPRRAHGRGSCLPPHLLKLVTKGQRTKNTIY